MNRDEEITRAVEPLFVTIEQIKYLFDDEDYLKSRVYNKYVAAVDDNLIHLYIDCNRVRIKPVLKSDVKKIYDEISNRIKYDNGISIYKAIEKNSINILFWKQL